MEHKDIIFDGIVNARHLGGMIGCNGRKVKNNLLIRCGDLFRASDSDVEKLEREYGVSLVFDFRTDYERDTAPDRSVEGAVNHHINIINTNGELWSLLKPQPGDTMSLHDRLLGYVLSGKASMMANGFYVSFVADSVSQSNYSKFFRLIIDDVKKGAVLWHCSQGKDRTGLAAAFLLSALGVDRNSIIDDFEYSNHAYTNELATVRKRVIDAGGSTLELEVVQGLSGVNVNWFIKALDYIDVNYGGMESYLHNQLKLSDNDLEVLRTRFLE